MLLRIKPSVFEKMRRRTQGFRYIGVLSHARCWREIWTWRERRPNAASRVATSSRSVFLIRAISRIFATTAGDTIEGSLNALTML